MNIDYQNKSFFIMSILIVILLIFIFLPLLKLQVIEHNIDKKIDANVYLYTEINLDEISLEKSSFDDNKY